MDEYRNFLGQPIGFPVPEWQACPRPPRTSLTGKYCRLDPLDPDIHAQQLYHAYAMDDALEGWTYLGYGPFNSIDAYKSWLHANCVGEDPLFYVITDSLRPEAVGVASYLRIDPDVGVVEVGHIHFSPVLQRTRAATEAMFLMMRRTFEELGYRRYEWKCDALNTASRMAAVRLGFTFEGVFRQARMYKGRNRDTAWYSIIDKEWPALKQAYESWLAPANFDEHGRQISSLDTSI